MSATYLERIWEARNLSLSSKFAVISLTHTYTHYFPSFFIIFPLFSFSFVLFILPDVFFYSLCLLSFRYNNLLAVISKSLSDIVKALKGLVVMSSELELMANSLFKNMVPDMWKAKASYSPSDFLCVPVISSYVACYNRC